MTCTVIDMAQYARRQHFDYFRSLPYPYVGVTENVDVSGLVRFCREKGCSFYLAFLHAAARAADGVPQLRQRIRDGGIVEYDACPTSHTELLSDGTYCYCTLRHDLPLDRYLPYAEEVRRLARENASIDEDDDVESMYFISALAALYRAHPAGRRRGRVQPAHHMGEIRGGPAGPADAPGDVAGPSCAGGRHSPREFLCKSPQRADSMLLTEQNLRFCGTFFVESLPFFCQAGIFHAYGE